MMSSKWPPWEASLVTSATAGAASTAANNTATVQVEMKSKNGMPHLTEQPLFGADEPPKKAEKTPALENEVPKRRAAASAHNGLNHMPARQRQRAAHRIVKLRFG